MTNTVWVLRDALCERGKLDYVVSGEFRLPEGAVVVGMNKELSQIFYLIPKDKASPLPTVTSGRTSR